MSPFKTPRPSGLKPMVIGEAKSNYPELSPEDMTDLAHKNGYAGMWCACVCSCARLCAGFVLSLRVPSATARMQCACWPWQLLALSSRAVQPHSINDRNKHINTATNISAINTWHARRFWSMNADPKEGTFSDFKDAVCAIEQQLHVAC